MSAGKGQIWLTDIPFDLLKMAELAAIIWIKIRSFSIMRSLTAAVHHSVVRGERNATVSGRQEA